MSKNVTTSGQSSSSLVNYWLALQVLAQRFDEVDNASPRLYPEGKTKGGPTMKKRFVARQAAFLLCGWDPQGLETDPMCTGKK